MKAGLSTETPCINNPDIQRNKAENVSTQYLKRGNFKSQQIFIDLPSACAEKRT
jgi:hypothetical protein